MSGLAVYRQGLRAKELASVIGPVRRVPSPRDVMTRSRGWFLTLRV